MNASQTTRKKGLADILDGEAANLNPPAKEPDVKTVKPSKAAIAPTAAYILQRKETRFRVDQIDALTAVAREINRAKPTGGERITENTLIRVAVDLLLSNRFDLKGETETEIRNSVGL